MKIELSDKQFELIQTIKTYKDVPHRLSDAKFDTLYDEIYNQFHSLHPNIYSSLYNLLIIIDNTLCFVGHKLPQNKIIYNFNTIKSNDNNQSLNNSELKMDIKPKDIPHFLSSQKFIHIDSLSNSQQNLIHLIKRYRELPHRLINKKLSYGLTRLYVTSNKINTLRNNIFNLFNKAEYPNLRMQLLTSILYIKIDISLLYLSDKTNANKEECITAINDLLFLLRYLNNHNDPLLIYLTQQLSNTKPSAFKLLQKKYPKFEQQIFLPLLVLHKYNSLFRPFLLTKIEEELCKNNYFNNSDSEITFHQLEKWGNEIILKGKLQLQ